MKHLATSPFFFRICVTTVAFGIFASSAHAASATWNGTTDAAWATDTNWSPAPVLPDTIPGTADTATFNNAGNGNTTIDLTGGVTVGNILFDTAAAAYTIGTTASPTLLIANNGTITVNDSVQNDQVFKSNIQLGHAVATPVNFSIINHSDKMLTFDGSINVNRISGFTTTYRSLNIGGVGDITLNGNLTKTNIYNYSITKSGAGTLFFNGTSSTLGQTNTIALTLNDGGSIDLGTSGVLVLDGSLSNHRVSIFAPNGGTITGGSIQTVLVGGQIVAGSGLTISSKLTGTNVIAKSGSLVLDNPNSDFSSMVIRGEATLSVNSIADGGVASPLGVDSVIDIGTAVAAADTMPASTTSTGTFIYTGIAAESDRQINLVGTTGGAILDQSGTGLLKFTHPETVLATGIGTKTLTLRGSTTGSGEIAGSIVDHSETHVTNLSKSGSGTWILSGASSYSGATTIDGGTLLANNTTGSATGSGTVSVNDGGILGGSGSIAGSVTASAAASLAPGASVGTLSMLGGLDISALAGGPGTLNFELGPIAASDRIAVTGPLNIGSGALGFSDFNFTTLGGLQNGTYKLITSGGISGTLDATNLSGPVGAGSGTLQITGNDLELVVSGVSGAAGYSLWASTNAPSGTSGDDFDGDGVSNGVEYVLGGSKNTDDLGKLPQVSSSGGNMLFTFQRDQDSIDGSTSIFVELGTDLATWNTASSPYLVPTMAATNVPGVSVVKDSPAPGIDTVTLSVPQAPDARKFARLKVITNP